MTSSNSKILIAEDHRLTAKFLKSILSGQDNFNVVDIALDGREVLSKMQTEAVDILLLDIEMPYMDGFEIMEYLKGAEPETKILVLSGHAEQDFVDRSIKMGASGYMTKGATPVEILEGINTIIKGDNFLFIRDYSFR